MNSVALAFQRFGLGRRRGDPVTAEDGKQILALELADPGAALLDDPTLQPSHAIFVAIRNDSKERKAKRKHPAPTSQSMEGGAQGDGAQSADMAMQGAEMAESAPSGEEQSGAPATAGSDAMEGDAKAAKGDKEPKVAQLTYRAEIEARLRKAASVQVGFLERLVDFWTNHFAVQASRKATVRGLAGSFEREAIRPHVLGRFEDMLVAATQHPAMLHSLDNVNSVGPDSPFGRGKQRGLNENHARELMELHTIGVDSGYTQADVTSLAKVLTGWTMDGIGKQSGSSGSFFFRRQWHEPGPQTVMGRIYPAGGLDQGMLVLHFLAGHPATAQHIARKLAHAFVADNPPPELVGLLADTFSKTLGDLGAVTRALVDSDLAWSPTPSKIKTPREYLFSAARALDISIDPVAALRALRDLGEPFWDPPSPAGFPVDTASWLAPNALETRVDVAERLASRADADIDPRALAAELFGPDLSQVTGQSIERAESGAQGLALLLMSPEFQRR